MVCPPYVRTSWRCCPCPSLPPPPLPKAVADKEQLYGSLDPTTLEWTDGVFTATLRAILKKREQGDALHC